MKKEEPLAIISCCDTEFAPHLAALFTSILENYKLGNNDLKFYVIGGDMDDYSKDLLASTLKKYKTSLTFLSIDKTLFTNVVTSNRLSESAYYRIAAPELICDEGIGKALYLDCDMIAVTDISALKEIDLKDFVLAAVEDAGFHGRFEKMNIQTDSNLYFNSGMMLINVKKWLQENTTKRVLKFVNEHPSILKFHDQDALNAVLHDRWMRLHPRWNAQRYILASERKHPQLQGEKEYKETRANPAIIHFTGHKKPWHSNYDLPFKKIYYHYADKTDFNCHPEHIHHHS